MKLKDALKRIEELERKVKELEARPSEYHYHYHPPVQQPWYPQPWYSQPVWMGGGGGIAQGTVTMGAGAGIGGGYLASYGPDH